MTTKLDKYGYKVIKDSCIELEKEAQKFIDDYNKRKGSPAYLINNFLISFTSHLAMISVANECLGKALEDEESTGNSKVSKLLS